MPSYFEPVIESEFFEPRQSDAREIANLAKIPAREMVRLILDNNFEKEVLKKSSYKMVVEGLDLKNIAESIDQCRVISCCNGEDIEPRALEGKTIITFDNFQWTIHFETGVLNINEGEKEYDLLCELLWKAL